MIENPYDVPQLTLSNTDDVSDVGERPLVISAVCVIVTISFICLLVVLPAAASRLANVYGSWYVRWWFVSLGVTAASVVGYWRMRRWGVYLYTVSFIAFSVLGLATGLPFTVVSVIGPIFFIALGFAYIRRMR